MLWYLSLILIKNHQCWSSFLVLPGHLKVLSRECLCRSSIWIFIGLLVFWYWGEWAFCTFWRLVSYGSHPLQLFSPILCYLLFVVQKAINLIRSLFFFFSIALGAWHKKTMGGFLTEYVFPSFFSRCLWCGISYLSTLAIFEFPFLAGVWLFN